MHINRNLCCLKNETCVFHFLPHSPHLFKTFVCYFCLYQATLTTETRFLNNWELVSLSNWSDIGFLETPNQLLLSMESFFDGGTTIPTSELLAVVPADALEATQGGGRSIRQDWLCAVLSWLCLTKLTSFLWTLDSMLLL